MKKPSPETPPLLGAIVADKFTGRTSGGRTMSRERVVAMLREYWSAYDMPWDVVEESALKACGDNAAAQADVRHVIAQMR